MLVLFVGQTEPMMGDHRTSAVRTPILSRFIDRSRHLPDHPALFVGDRFYTYGELHDLSSAIWARLKAHGIRRGDRVGILAENSIYTYASLLGVLSCGACYVPLNSDNPLERNRGIIAEAGIKALLYTDNEPTARNLSLSADRGCQPLSNRVTPNAGRRTPVEATPGDLCYLLFTSGTTGKPKGVPIYHRNLSAFLDMMLQSGRYDFNSNDRFLQMFELTFDLSVFSFLVPLSVGATFYPIPHKGMAYLEVADTLETREITVALMVPSIINYLKPYFGEINLPKMRYNLFCGEALYHETLSSW